MNQVAAFNNYPFFDDFDNNKNYKRILFRPGFSVQTRELNQLQTILQQQISHVSDLSVSDKTAVIGGNINFNKKIDYIKIKKGTTLSKSILEYNNNVEFTTSNGISGKLLFLTKETATDNCTLYVQYTRSSTNGSHVPNRGTNIVLTFSNTDIETFEVSNLDEHVGFGTYISLNDSIFYAKNTFVKIPAQALVLSKYNNDSDNYNIGILINEEVISPEEDFTLYDNAFGTPNESAPGAHRYKISGVLIDKKDVPDNQLSNFIEMIRLDKGEIAVKPKEESSFIPLLQQILARRTYDESGDYIVDTFDLDIKEHLLVGSNNGLYKPPVGNEALFVAELDPGVAYIRGFEVRINDITRLNIEKARETLTTENSVTQLNYSNFIIVSVTAGDVTIGGKIEFFNVGNTKIGSAYISAVDAIDINKLKIYLVNIELSAPLNDILTVKAAAGVSSLVSFSSTIVSHKIPNVFSPLVLPLPYGYSKSTTPNSIVFSKTFSALSSNGNVVLTNEDASEIFSLDVNDYYVYNQNGNSGIPNSVLSSGNNTVTLDISSVLTTTAGQKTVKIITKIYSTSPKIKTKTLVGSNSSYFETKAATLLVNNKIMLDNADGYRLLKVTDENNIEVTDKFNFDNGSRDSHYQLCSVSPKNGIKLDSRSVFKIYYSYFNHSSNGDFFSVNSYVGLSYDKLPTFVDSSGSNIFLGSAYDFRKIISSDNISQTSRGHVVLTDRIISDITYYLPRKDRIMITAAGNIVHVKGIAAFNPNLPEELSNAITLYNLTIYPYVFSINDIVSDKLNHKRYTMKDIGKLDNRLKNVEEVALLNKLEADTASLNFTDRFKSGYIVDNFSTSDTGDITSPHFGVAYDLIDPSIRPKVISDFIDMKVSLAESSNIKYHEETGIVTLDYTVTDFIKQDLGSDIVKIQPYISYGWGTATINLTPSIDVWKEEFQHTVNLYTSTTNRLDDIIIGTSSMKMSIPKTKAIQTG